MLSPERQVIDEEETIPILKIFTPEEGILPLAIYNLYLESSISEQVT